jgi:hypothetical protein
LEASDFMSNNSNTIEDWQEHLKRLLEEDWQEVLEKLLEPEYKQINKELEPLLRRILYPVDKKSSEIIQLKENAKEWYRRFIRAYQISGKVVSIQKLILTTEEPQIVSTLKLFQYLGFVESIGTNVIDMLVLLLITDGKHFHVEKSYGLPRIVHAKNFKDLDSPNSSLSEKLSFLKNNGLERTSKICDRTLRNDIAHLNFDIDKQGKISTRHCKELDVDEKLKRFHMSYIVFLHILKKTGFIDFLNRAIKESE